MRFPPPAELLYLDFDGVLCDSLEECFRSSWLAASGVAVGPAVPPAPPSDPEYRSRFTACRPFIRSGEDYLMAHQWAARGAVPGSQSEFDASLAEAGPVQLADWKRRLYEVRDRMLEHHRTLWLSWNPLYDGMGAALKTQTANPAVWILSTKKAEFIVEILAHHGVSWPLERTIYTGSQKKLDIIGEQAKGRASELIDDQVDHLDFGHPSCRCFLALWGYVAPGASGPAGATLQLPEAAAKVSAFPLPDRAQGA